MPGRARRWPRPAPDPDAATRRRREREQRAYNRRHRRDQRRERWARRAAVARRPVLVVAGLACLTAAVWLLHRGLAAAGVAFLLLEWLTGPEPPRTPRPPRR